MLLDGPLQSLRTIWGELGYGYSVIIAEYQGDRCDWLYSWDDLYSMLKRLMDNFRKDKNYLEWLKKRHKEKIKEYLAFENALKARDLSSLSNERLFSLMRGLNSAFTRVLDVGHIIECFTLTKEKDIRDLIKKEAPPRDYEKIFSILTAPSSKPFQTRFREDLAKADSEKKLKEVQENWFWAHNGYSHSHVLSVEEFRKERAGLKRAKAFIVSTKKKLETIKKYSMGDELKHLIMIQDAMFEIHDSRKEYTTRAIHYIDTLLKELGRRYSIPVSDMRYLRLGEINDEFLKHAGKVLENRKDYCVVIFTRNLYEMLTGKKARDYFSLIKTEAGKDATGLKGFGASPGKVTGIVKICRGIGEISKIKQGMILVAPMTQPEYMPAIKKAKAIVTDEGGITCHAAIISREMKIPCIIGTRNATRVLKDGDSVEVDANKGIVRILKK